ncbi:MAG: DinB family protein [Nocardioidaceae bacterium]
MTDDQNTESQAGSRPTRQQPDMWVDHEDDPRDLTATPRGEAAVVLGYLRFYRTTLEMKCDGLDAEQMARRSVPPSTMSLLGLVRHLARVEHSWFRRVIEGQDLPRLFSSKDDHDHDFNGAVADDAVVAEAWESWRREVAHADEVVAGLASWDVAVDVHGEPCEVRDILVHLVEEYARHLGHADLLRECIDGRTGQ